MADSQDEKMPPPNGNAKGEPGPMEEKRPFLVPTVEVTDGTGKSQKLGDEDEEPIDRYYLVYVVMVIHGIGTLMPWNMFITATSYFIDYKLHGEGNEQYRHYFLSSLGFASQIPNLLLNLVNVFAQCGGGGGLCSQAARITWSIIIVVVMFIFTIILAMIDTSDSVKMFFWVTMLSVIIINSANGVYQNSIYGTAACLPMKYTNAVVTGSNTSGTITAVLNLIALAVAPNPRTAAIYYFLAAVFVLLLAFDAYFILPLSKFYRFYKDRATAHMDDDEKPSYPPYLQIFKQCYVQHLSVWFVFFVTLTCFPAILAGVESSSDNFIISDKYFTAVTCFLFFNTFALLGNIVTEFIKVPGPRFVWLPVLLRGFFIPFFMYCNYNPEGRALPVLVTNDYVYSIGVVVFAFTSGYFSSICMMYAPRCVPPENQGIAGMLSAFFLILGIFTGVLFSFPVTIFINIVGPLNADGGLMPINGTTINATEPLLLSTVQSLL